MTDTEATYVQADPGWAAEVRQLAARRDAVILAHNYQAPEIQDVADHVGDSLALSRLAAASTASVIVFAGVYFMAETAKILAPDRTVLIPEPKAGCSLADAITAEQVREWKAGHPGAVVVAYVNTSAEVKAESDLCCTSAWGSATYTPGSARTSCAARPVPGPRPSCSSILSAGARPPRCGRRGRA